MIDLCIEIVFNIYINIIFYFDYLRYHSHKKKKEKSVFTLILIK